MSNFLIYILNLKYCHGKLCIAYQLVIIFLVVFLIFLDVHNFRVVVIALSCIVFVLLVVIGVLIWRNRRSEPNNRTTRNKNITDEIGQPKSPRDQPVSEPGVYMELHPRPSDGQSRAPAEYQTLQGRHMTSGFYTDGFKGGSKKEGEEETYDEVENYQC